MITFFICLGYALLGLGFGTWLIRTSDFNESAERMSMYLNRDRYAVFTVVMCILLWPIVLGYVIFDNDDVGNV